MQTKTDPPADAGLQGNELRVAVTRDKICTAVIRCLDEVGYSETSINRVQQLAGVSRGALTHHFPSKEAMMVETLERLLDPVRGQPGTGDAAPTGLARMAGQGRGIQEDLHFLWRKVVNTSEGRALLEILVASRTDAQLRTRIAPSLETYNSQINSNILNLYAATGDQPDDIQMMWSICRCFLRGLHTQSPYETDPEAINRMVDRFGQMIAPHMTTRTKQERSP